MLSSFSSAITQKLAKGLGVLLVGDLRPTSLWVVLRIVLQAPKIVPDDFVNPTIRVQFHYNQIEKPSNAGLFNLVERGELV